MDITHKNNVNDSTHPYQVDSGENGNGNGVKGGTVTSGISGTSGGRIGGVGEIGKVIDLVDEEDIGGIGDEDLWGVNGDGFKVDCLRARIVNQWEQFDIARQKFKQNKYQGLSFVYLISKAWLSTWRQLVLQQTNPNTQQIQPQLLSKFLSECINADITKPHNSTLPIESPHFNHLNSILKQQVQKGKDYAYISKQMWEVFRAYRRIQVKRKIKEYKGTKYVEENPAEVSLIVVSNQMLKDLGDGKRDKLEVETFLVPLDCTVEFFQKVVIKALIKKMGNQPNQDINELRSSSFDFHYTLENWNVPKITKRILKSLKSQKKLKFHNIDVPSVQQFDHSCTIQQALGTTPTILCELTKKSQKTPPQTRILFDSRKTYPFSQCIQCKRFKQLTQFCACKYVAFCNQICRQKCLGHFKVCKAVGKNKGDGGGERERGWRNGLVGLKNLGNTCYMNCAIQCMSNMEEITEYFLEDGYKIDLAICQKKLGQLTEAYSNLVKKIWKTEAKVISPVQFKDVQCLKDFLRNYEQHDASQFITCFLQALHEQLNMAISKSTPTTSPPIPPQPQTSQSHWQTHLSLNNSKISQKMYGQLRSELTCPLCLKKSTNFDTFMVCELPIVENRDQVSYQWVEVVLQHDYYQEKLEIYCRSRGRLGVICRRIGDRKGLRRDQRVFLYTRHGQIDLEQRVCDFMMQTDRQIYARVLKNFQSEDGIQIFVTFLYKSPVSPHHHPPQKLYKPKKSLLLPMLQKNLYDCQSQFHNLGDYSTLPKNPKQRPIQLRTSMRYRYMYGSCFVCGKDCQGCLVPEEDVPVGVVMDVGVVYGLEFVVFGEMVRRFYCLGSVGRSLGLMECFESFIQPEILSADNQWNCSNCHKPVNAKKTITIYKAPSILIICLKRFKHQLQGISKNTRHISYPVQTLDLTDIIPTTQTPQPIYQLFAVVCHSGTAERGHYTAICWNFVKKAWYYFDDEKVQEIQRSQVVTPKAYLLFYRRKSKY